MRRQIDRAEAYCKTLIGQSTETKEAKLYAKFGAVLGIETCKTIAKNH